MFARMILKAHSTCQAGTVSVSFQELTVYTKALQLSTEPTSYVLKFLADKKCYKEKLCLRAQTLVQCQTIEFCLDEPSIELYNLNLNYTHTSSSSTDANWFNWFHIPTMSNSLLLLKVIGSTLFIVCVIITLLSTILTCCCRTR